MRIITTFWIRFSMSIAVSALCTATAVSAQESHKSKFTSIPSPPQPKVGLLLLDLVQSEAAGLQPDSRAFVLWQASYGYRNIDPEKADMLLRDAFRVTLSLPGSPFQAIHGEAELNGTKYWLQKQILQEMIKQSAQTEELEQFLASAEPEVRQMLSTNLFRHFVEKKAFGRARDLLNQMADENSRFPYRAATELMDALPRERAEDRVAIFSQALDSYKQHSDELYPSFYDLATLVLRFWSDLPSSIVLDAVNQILDRAKAADERQQGIRVGLAATRGDAYFSSVYQFRLYELIPVLQQLNEALAKNLLDQNSEVEMALAHYPKGLASMGPLAESNTQSGRRGVRGILSIGATDPARVPAEDAHYEIARRQEQIRSEAEKEPERALSDAKGLPLNSLLEPTYSPRAATLTSVAWIAATSNPAVSRAALGELRKAVENMPARSQAQMLEKLPDIYLRLGDEDEALNSLDDLVEIAVKLYSDDSDLDDPNQAFKGMWPSVNLWRHCVELATKLAPSLAAAIIEGIPDDEIKTFEIVSLANLLLGANSPAVSTIEKHNKGVSAFIVP